MDIQHLKYFVEVVRQESFTRAAAQLFVTQPMLTRSIKQLEESLNVLLIERTSKSFHLTDAGRILYERAQEFLMQYEAIFQTMADVRSVKTGEVRLSIPGVLLDMYFPELFASFHRQYPGIDISLVEEGSKLTAASVGLGKADLGLVMLPVEEPSRFESHLLVSDVCQLVVSREHPFAQMPGVHIRELRGETILTFSETATLHDTFIQMCGEQGFAPRIAYKSLMPGFSFKMVAMQQCIALLPLPLILHGMCDKLVTVPLEPRIVWDIAPRGVPAPLALVHHAGEEPFPVLLRRKAHRLGQVVPAVRLPQAGELKAVAGRAAAVLKPPLHRVWQADAPPIPAQQFSPHHARRTSSPARIRFGFLIWGLRAISSVRLRP